MQRWYSLLLPRSAKSIAWLAILIVFAVGFLALIGWLLDITLLKSIEPQWISMRLITALCFIFSAVELALLQKSPSAVRKFIVLQAPGVLIGLVGLLTIVIYARAMIIGQESSLEYLSFFNLFLAPMTRMALLTGILFLINGCALVLLAIDSRRTANIAHALMLPGAMLSYIVPVSYLLGVQAIHEWLNVPVALNTGLAFCALSVAIFCSRPDTWLMSGFTGDRSGSVMARQLLPALLMLPLLIGWLRLHGERAGYFESAVGVVLVAITYAACFLFLLWLSARSVNLTDDKRQIAEQALRESEEKYRTIVETANEGIWITDAERKTILINQRMADMLGYRIEEMIGRVPSEFLDEDQEQLALKIREKLKAGNDTHEEFKFHRKDGSVLWVISNATPLYDTEGHFNGTLSMLTDITERKQAEEELSRHKAALEEIVKERTRELEERYTELREEISERKKAEDALRMVSAYNRSLIDSSLDPLVTIDANGRITDVNKATENVTGQTRVELIGTDFSDYFTEPEKARAGYKQAFSEGSVQDYSLEILHRDGHITSVLYNASVYHDRTGEVLGVFAAARDITELRRAEEEKKKLEVQLMQAQRMEALGKLAGGIAHDLNNILQPILINSEMISDKLPQGTQEREYLDQIIDAAQLGKNLTRQIKLYGSSQKPILDTISIGPVIHKALNIVKQTLSSNIKLYQRITMNAHLVNADPTQINQLVLNLCSNAVQSMTPQGGTLDVSLDETEVTKYTPAIGNDLRPGKYMILTISDTGFGINPEIMKNIFDPFFTTRKSDKGTGLGLAVVYEVVKNSQGSILLYSEVGKGTRFEILFPLHLDSLK